MVISPDEGLLSLEPDSPEWFAWLQRFLLSALSGDVAVSLLSVDISLLLVHPGGHIARFTTILNGVASVFPPR